MKQIMLSCLVFSFAALDLGCADPDYRDPKGRNTGQKLDPSCPLSLKQLKLCTAIDWKTTPNENGGAIFILRFWQKDLGTPAGGPYLDPAGSLDVVLYMPEMHHGNPNPVTITRLSPGVFQISNVTWIMTGAWEIQIEIKEQNRVLDRATQQIEIQ